MFFFWLLGSFAWLNLIKIHSIISCQTVQVSFAGKSDLILAAGGKAESEVDQPGSGVNSSMYQREITLDKKKSPQTNDIDTYLL